MTEFMKKKDIITYKEQGMSNRSVARKVRCNRKTVARYWNEYQERLVQLEVPGADTKAIQDSLLSAPKYPKRVGRSRKYTEDLDKRLREILKDEEKKRSSAWRRSQAETHERPNLRNGCVRRF